MAHEDQSNGTHHDERETRGGLLDRIKILLRLKAPATLRDEIEDALSSPDNGEQPDFSPAERIMLQNILGLRDLHVDDVKVPRPDIVAVSADLALSDVLICFEQAEHSRLPVYGETIDDLKGMVHIKDVLRYLTTRSRSSGRLDLGKPDLSVSVLDAHLVRDVLYVPPSMSINDLLTKMQATHIHMALVIDEHGGTDGLVTIEDLVEMVVGDIEDEHDEVEGPGVFRARDGSLIAQGRAPLEDLIEELGPGVDFGDLADEVDTISGLLVTLAGRVPVRSEIIAGPGDIDLEVLDADPRRVKRVRVRRRPAEDGTSAPEAGKGAA